MPADRPQAPGYLANLMARLFHEVAEEGLAPLGIRPEQFPMLAALWYGAGELSLDEFQSLHEVSPAQIDALVRGMVADGIVEKFPSSRREKIVLTPKAMAARDGAVGAAVRANKAATQVLTPPEMEQFMAMMNRVIDALQRAKSPG